MRTVTRSYSPDDIIIVVGEENFEGKGEDEFCRITFVSDIAEDKTGVDGEVVVCLTNDWRADVTLTGAPGTPFNDYLSTLGNLLKNRQPGCFKFFKLIDKASGRTVFTSPNSYVNKFPEVIFGKQPGDREWNIRCPHLNGVLGGMAAAS